MDHEVLRQFLETGIPFNRVLGIQVVTLDHGHARLEIPFHEQLVGDPFRPALHGGVLGTLADTAAGAAVYSRAEDDRPRVSTIDLRMDYLRPARLERLAADARVVRMGNRVAVVDVRLFHPATEDEIIATAKGVFNVSPTKKA